ncbi:MAG: amino acid ABC transporter substrate-binding protein [bacterium]|nr:amino acid ABC transporter substrate-binding protein [bacterium]
MKKYLKTLAPALALFLSACGEAKTENELKFATCADYPPFECYKNGELIGLDIELAQLVAKELGKEAVFENMKFGSILAAIQNGTIDAGISTFTVTPERSKNFDFSATYYTESLSMVFPEGAPVTNIAQLSGKKIACQLGSSMEIWLKQKAPSAQITLVDNNNQAIEALKAGHVDGVIIDSFQASAFTNKNPALSHASIGKSDTGYAIALAKDSPLKDQINSALEKLEASGELKKLQVKWLGTA